MIDLVVLMLVLCGFVWFTMWLINKYIREEENVVVYVVICNDRVSSEGYKTLKKAQEFCKSRADKPEMVGNGWCFMSNECVYVIKDIRVE